MIGLCFVCQKYTEVTVLNNIPYCKKHIPKIAKEKYFQYKKEVKCNCLYCGLEFTKGGGTNQKYCSKECGLKAYTLSKDARQYIIFERDDFTCFYCGKTSYTDKVKLHVDHIFPRSLGGISTADNLVTACQLCNLSKHTRLIRNIDRVYQEIQTRNKRANIENKQYIKLSSKDIVD